MVDLEIELNSFYSTYSGSVSFQLNFPRCIQYMMYCNTAPQSTTSEDMNGEKNEQASCLQCNKVFKYCTYRDIKGSC